jgi:hypothetical protein
MTPTIDDCCPVLFMRRNSFQVMSLQTLASPLSWLIKNAVSDDPASKDVLYRRCGTVSSDNYWDPETMASLL